MSTYSYEDKKKIVAMAATRVWYNAHKDKDDLTKQEQNFVSMAKRVIEEEDYDYLLSLNERSGNGSDEDNSESGDIEDEREINGVSKKPSTKKVASKKDDTEEN